jgi:hypothetical protein
MKVLTIPEEKYFVASVTLKIIFGKIHYLLKSYLEKDTIYFTTSDAQPA